MMLISTVSIKYLLPVLWELIIEDIYGDFCGNFPLIPGDDELLCDDLKLEVTLHAAVYIAGCLVLVLLGIFCCINDFECKCSKAVYGRYGGKPTMTETWNFEHSASAFTPTERKQSRSVNDRDFDHRPSNESGVGLARLVLPYSSMSSSPNTQ